MWPGLLAMIRGFATSSGIASMFGVGAGGFPNLRKVVNAKRFFGGVLGRGAVSGGWTGAASRLGLGFMARQRGKKRGRGGALPPSVVGFLGRDLMTVAGALGNLANTVRGASERVAGPGGLSMFSATFAEGNALLERGRRRRAAEYARSVGPSEMFANKAQDDLEQALEPVNEFFTDVKNFGVGLGKEALSQMIRQLTAPMKIFKGLKDFLGGNAQKGLDEIKGGFLDSVGLGPVDDIIKKMKEDKEKVDKWRAQGGGKGDNGPEAMQNDWWKMKVPEHDSMLAITISEIARGKFHTANTKDAWGRRKPPLPPVNGPGKKR